MDVSLAMEKTTVEQTLLTGTQPKESQRVQQLKGKNGSERRVNNCINRYTFETAARASSGRDGCWTYVRCPEDVMGTTTGGRRHTSTERVRIWKEDQTKGLPAHSLHRAKHEPEKYPGRRAYLASAVPQADPGNSVQWDTRGDAPKYTNKGRILTHTSGEMSPFLTPELGSFPDADA
ncbi:hypothetical protein B0H10DRAFT_1942960 [Mycena sp. CBHHK59/15]|nr:hypothetical protein B0H10DRAFT_1942960 [Mycena sp. CBHHK59/15]